MLSKSNMHVWINKKKKKGEGKNKRRLQGLGSLVSKSPRTFLSAVIGAFSATVAMASFDT
jgi:hypothetical protein